MAGLTMQMCVLRICRGRRPRSLAESGRECTGPESGRLGKRLALPAVWVRI